MNDDQVLRSMMRDDAYHVVKLLGDGSGGRTELVTFDGEKLLVRKRIPYPLDNATAWASLMGHRAAHLPLVESIYQMPDELVVVYTYVEGQSLRDIVEREGALPHDSAASIVCDVCEAASTLHSRGVIHRDITPNNVIVAADGAYLVDLGIARQHAEGQRRDTTMLGTWGFAAPEQYGFAQTDERSDVYALGRLLGYVLTGVMPGDDAYEKGLADCANESRSLVEVVLKASAFEPSARYQSARELMTAIRLAQGSSDLSGSAQGSGEAKDAAPTRPSSVSRGHSAAYVPPMRQPNAVYPGVHEAMFSPRSFSDAPLPLRILFVVFTVAIAFWEFMLVYTTGLAMTINEPPWGPAQYGMALVTGIAPLVFLYEIYHALTRRGAYARSEGVIGLLLQRTCIIVAVTFVLLCVVAIALPGQKTS